jgi:hypothetical protein
MNLPTPIKHTLTLLFLLTLPLIACDGDGDGNGNGNGNGTPSSKWSLWSATGGPHLRGAVLHQCSVGRVEGGGYVCTSLITKQDIQDLRNQGANLINASYPGVYSVLPPYGPSATELAFLDDLIDWAEEVGIYIVISFRSGPGRNEAAIHDAPGATYAVWTSPDAQAAWGSMWRYTAQRYAGRDVVIGYDLMVEPHPNTVGSNSAAWNNLAAAITDSIRQVDTETPIIIESVLWANVQEFPDLVHTGDSLTVYSFHQYNPDCYTNQDENGTLSYPGTFLCEGETITLNSTWLEQDLSPALTFSQTHNVPIFAGEFGSVRWVPNATQYHTDLLAFFEQYGWNYTVYVWRGDDDEGGYLFDGFNLELGTDPNNHTAVPGNALLNAHTSMWGLNTHYYTTGVLQRHVLDP